MKHSTAYKPDELKQILLELNSGLPLSDVVRTSIVAPLHGFARTYIEPRGNHSYVARLAMPRRTKLNVYMLRDELRISDDYEGEAVILKNPANNSFIVTIGERHKSWFVSWPDTEIIGFQTKGENPIKEIKSLISTWENVSIEFAKPHKSDRAIGLAVDRIVERVSFKEAALEFLIPILGPDCRPPNGRVKPKPSGCGVCLGE